MSPETLIRDNEYIHELETTGCAIARKIGVHRDATEDVVQDALIAFVRQVRNGRVNTEGADSEVKHRGRQYFKGIVRNIIKAKQRQRATDLLFCMSAFESSSSDAGSWPDFASGDERLDEMTFKELLPMVNRAIRSATEGLPPVLKKVVAYDLDHEIPEAKSAAIDLGMTEQSVRKARERYRHELSLNRELNRYFQLLAPEIEHDVVAARFAVQGTVRSAKTTVPGGIGWCVGALIGRLVQRRVKPLLMARTRCATRSNQIGAHRLDAAGAIKSLGGKASEVEAVLECYGRLTGRPHGPKRRRPLPDTCAPSPRTGRRAASFLHPMASIW